MGSQMVFKRYEIKYLMNYRQKDAVLQAMEPYMSMDEYGHSLIRNISYDTPAFRLIRESMEKDTRWTISMLRQEILCLWN